MDTYIEDIKNRLQPLTNEQKLLFAALICEKLYPNYLYFHDRVNWGDPKILLDSIDVIYQSLFVKGLFSNQEIQNHIDAVDMITPDLDDFSGSFVSFALDACTSVYSSLCFILDQNPNHIADVASYARDTVDMFVQVRDDLDTHVMDLETKIDNDPLMIHEKSRQLTIIERLKSLNGLEITDSLIQSLRDKSFIIDLEDIV